MYIYLYMHVCTYHIHVSMDIYIYICLHMYIYRCIHILDLYILLGVQGPRVPPFAPVLQAGQHAMPCALASLYDRQSPIGGRLSTFAFLYICSVFIGDAARRAWQMIPILDVRLVTAQMLQAGYVCSIIYAKQQTLYNISSNTYIYIYIYIYIILSGLPVCLLWTCVLRTPGFPSIFFRKD